MSRPFGLCRVFLLLCAIAVCWGAHVPAAAADARPGVYLFGASLADAYPLLQGHALQLVLPGDVHPNNAGYGVLARLFIHALSR